MKKILITVPVLVAVMLAAVFVACAVAVDGALSAVDTTLSEPLDPAAPDATGRLDRNPSWGQTVTFDDGSKLTCKKPVKFTLDEFAAGGEESAVHLKSKCTFTNGTDEIFDPALSSGSMTAGGTEGDSVYQDGLDAPDNPVLPGRSVTWWMGYGVKSTDDVQLTVDVGFLDYDSVTFSE